MKKPANIILLSLVAILVAAVSAWWGWQVAANSQTKLNIAGEEVVDQLVEVYFYRTDGIYKITSDNTETQQIVETAYDDDNPYYFNPSFEIMGENSNWLVYKDVIGKDDQTNEIFFGLVVYDMDKQEPVLSFSDDDSSVTTFLVSPEKNKLVFVVQRRDTDKTVSQGPEPFYQQLMVWDGEGKAKIALTEDSGFFGLGLGIWLDNDSITIGRGYEGISYCEFDLVADSELPKSCEGYGSSTYGGTEMLEKATDDWLYGYRYEWTEMTGARNPSMGIFKQPINGNKTYLTNDVPSDLVIGQENIYYLKSNLDSSKFVYNGVDSDLYMLSADGSLTKRLTNDGNSVMAKSNLNLSNDGRFVGYQVTDISGVPPTDNNLKTTQDHSAIWLYDTQLNKYYQLADQALAPKVITKNSN